MNLPSIQANWLPWSIQVFVLSAAGCLAPRVLRMTDPKSRLLGAQFTLLVCLIVPFATPRQPGAGKVGVAASEDLSRPVPGRRLPRQRSNPWALAIPGIIAAGALIRFARLLTGLAKLREIRKSSRALEPQPSAIAEAFCLTETTCRIAMVDGSHSPAAFGLFRPIVLLPAKFLSLSQEAQIAIACHELLHVRRNDWLAALTEEVAGALLWFQPWVYLLQADIRLAREQLVDRGAVGLTRAKAPYVEALLAVAAAPFGAAIAVAPPFLHRKNLKSRVEFLVKELSMSKTKIVLANVSLAALLGAAGWVATASFPLKAVAQTKDSGAGKITVADGEPENYDFSKAFDAPIGRRLRVGGNQIAKNLVRQVKPAYPPDAKAQRIQGKVRLGVLIGTGGHIDDLVLISGHPLLTQASSDAVRQWVYRPVLLNGEPVEVVSIVDVNFTLQQ